MGVSFRWALAPYLREGISDVLGRGLVIRVLTVLPQPVGNERSEGWRLLFDGTVCWVRPQKNQGE